MVITITCCDNKQVNPPEPTDPGKGSSVSLFSGSFNDVYSPKDVLLVNVSTNYDISELQTQNIWFFIHRLS